MYAQPGKSRVELARGYDLECAATVFLKLGMQTNTVWDRRLLVKQLSALIRNGRFAKLTCMSQAPRSGEATLGNAPSGGTRRWPDGAALNR